MKIHASHPLIERYSLCGVTHEGNENFPVRVAYAGERVDCVACREVIDECKRFYALHDYSRLSLLDEAISESQRSKQRFDMGLIQRQCLAHPDESWSFTAEQLLVFIAQLQGSPDKTIGWQPIETAPISASDAVIDLQYVLVVYPGRGGRDPMVMMAYQDSLGWDTGYWRLHETPTHWMPLPDPPALAPNSPEAHTEPGCDQKPRDSVG